MNNKKIANYIFELGVLKKFRHSGFKFAGVQNPDSIAEHAYRAAIIAYLLAVEEKHKNPEKVAFMCLVHDNAEARISDLHKIAQRYISTTKPEKKAYQEQVKNLPPQVQKSLLKYFDEYETRKTIEGKIIRDADLLETAFQAKEYVDLGHKAAIDWIDNVEKCVYTKTAKSLVTTIRKTTFTEWFKGLKKIDK